MADEFDVKRYLEQQESYHKSMAESIEVIRNFGEQMVEVHKQTASYVKEQRAAAYQAEQQGFKPGERCGLVMRAFMAAKGQGDQVGKLLNDTYRAPMVAQTLDRWMEADRTVQVQHLSQGGFTVPIDFFDEMIPLLRPASSLAELGARMIPLGAAGSTIPRLIEGTIVEWVGETGQPTETEPKWGSLNLAPKKLMASVPISNDWLVATANRSVNGVIAQDVMAGMSQEQSRCCFNGDGVMKPLGLFVNPLRGKITNSTRSGYIGGPKLMRRFISDWKKGNYGRCRQNPGLVFNEDAACEIESATNNVGAFLFRDEMAQGKLWRQRIVEDWQLTTSGSGKKPTQVAMGDWAEYFIATFRGLELAYSIHTKFKQDCTELRVLWAGDQGPRQLGAFAVNDTMETEE